MASQARTIVSFNDIRRGCVNVSRRVRTRGVTRLACAGNTLARPGRWCARTLLGRGVSTMAVRALRVVARASEAGHVPDDGPGEQESVAVGVPYDRRPPRARDRLAA